MNHLVFQEPGRFNFSPEGFWKAHLAANHSFWLAELLDTTGLLHPQATGFFSPCLAQFLVRGCPTRHTL